MECPFPEGMSNDRPLSQAAEVVSEYWKALVPSGAGATFAIAGVSRVVHVHNSQTAKCFEACTQSGKFFMVQNCR